MGFTKARGVGGGAAPPICKHKDPGNLDMMLVFYCTRGLVTVIFIMILILTIISTSNSNGNIKIPVLVIVLVIILVIGSITFVCRRFRVLRGKRYKLLQCFEGGLGGWGGWGGVVSFS